MHILLVEDNPGDIELCRAALEMAPCSVELSVAKTGVDALRMLRGELPLATPTPLALVLLDLNLPLKNGFEVLAELRRAPERLRTGNRGAHHRLFPRRIRQLEGPSLLR